MFARVSVIGENTLIILRSASGLNVSRDSNKLFFLVAAFLRHSNEKVLIV